MTPSVSVVIPTYNRAEMVSDCVASVLATDWPALEVVVVDDCSPDDMRDVLARRFPGDARVRCVRNERNLMTTGSRNRGAAEAHGDYLLFLDHDNRMRPDAIAELVACFARHPDAVLAGAVSINLERDAPPSVWSLGSDFNRWTSRPVEKYAGVPERDLPDLPDDLPTTYAPNAFMVRREAFDAVGGFDPAIGMMFDESDFGWRLLARLGGSAWFATRARTEHCGHVDPLVPETPLRRLGIEKPERARCFARNRLRFARRHFSRAQALAVTLVFAPLSAAYYGLVACRNGRPDVARAYLAGTLAGAFEGLHPLALWRNSAPFRFLVVGGWNFVFGYAVFALPYWVLHGRVADWLIATGAAIAGITMSFVTHRFLTYRSHGCWWREYLRFYVVYGAQSVLNVFLIWLLVTRMEMNAYAVQLAISVALTVGSYWAHKLYSFRSVR